LIELPPGVVDLRPKCVLRLVLHIVDMEGKRPREIQTWQTPEIVLDGPAPDPMILGIDDHATRQRLVWMFVLDRTEKPETGPQVMIYAPYAVTGTDQRFFAMLTQMKFSPLLISEGPKGFLMPGVIA
jgi:hypothetical protein